jgi:hypothetical protein
VRSSKINNEKLITLSVVVIFCQLTLHIIPSPDRMHVVGMHIVRTLPGALPHTAAHTAARTAAHSCTATQPRALPHTTKHTAAHCHEHCRTQLHCHTRTAALPYTTKLTAALCAVLPTAHRIYTGWRKPRSERR